MSDADPGFVIPPPARPSVPVLGEAARFPVRRVYCVGRNYAAHAIEMGHDPAREDPFFFQKNADDLDPSGRFPYPAQSRDVHHEAELAIYLGLGGADLPPERALDHVFGYGLALDMTRRDLQAEMKKTGRPWEIGKAFERSAPVGRVHPVARVGHPARGGLTLRVNGEVRQQGDFAQMIWKVPELIAYLSRFFRLEGGDAILSGTPAGVGPVVAGDTMEVSADGFEPLRVRVE